ncbi:nucleotidyltransferase family protein [Rothia sp. P13129]|uniref:nucleotidyltransferase family protein n=1 Tax=Rothia sp. P13129 TaxID=3402664 RepID=UPI003AD03F70
MSDHLQSNSSTTEQQVSLPVRIRLSHAYFQHLADLNGIDILHIKGYAFEKEAYRPGRTSTDVDVLVRPAHVERFIYILNQAGWQTLAHFETGSIFEHAQTLYHPSWGLTDIHRYFPGLGYENPTRAFDQLWERRRVKEIAHYPCMVPSLIDMQLIVVLHGARASAKVKPDITFLDSSLEASDWDNLRTRAEELDSLLAFDTALGNIEAHKDSRHYLLWKSVSEDSTPAIQWTARLRRAKTLGDKWRVIKSIVAVNEDHLAMTLGRKPTRQELREKFFERFTAIRRKR